MALPRQAQQAGRVGGERGQHELERLPAGEQHPQRLPRGRRTADVHRRDPALGVEDPQAPAAVRANGNPGRIPPRAQIARQRLVRAPRILALSHGERSDVDGAAPVAQGQGLVEKRAPAIDVGRIEDPGGQLASIQRLANELQASGAVAHVQVHDAGLPAHEPAHVRVARHAEQLVERRLARAMVADRQLADAEDQVDQDDVQPDAAGGGGGRHVIAAGVAPGAEPLRHQAARHRHQLGGRAHGVVGAEHADRRRDAAEREPGERHRRHPRLGAGLAAPAGQVHVAVDEPGDHPASAEVGFLHRKRAVERRNVLAGPEHSLPRHQQVPAAARLRIVELGVSEQGEHPAHASLNPPTAPVSRAAASARWPAEFEISSVDALSCCAAAAISSAAAA